MPWYPSVNSGQSIARRPRAPRACHTRLIALAMWAKPPTWWVADVAGLGRGVAGGHAEGPVAAVDVVGVQDGEDTRGWCYRHRGPGKREAHDGWSVN